MVEVLLKIGKFLLVVAFICFGVWALNQFGVIDGKMLFLQTASQIPGLSDLADRYELGDKRANLLKEKEADLKARETKLATAQKKLAEAQTRFKEEQFQWQRDRPATTNSKPIQTNSTAISPGNINQPATPDAKIKDYLTMLGKMKPRQAASVIQKLPEETVFTIFEQLNQFQVIKIMENLPEDYLARLTQDRLNQYRNR